MDPDGTDATETLYSSDLTAYNLRSCDLAVLSSCSTDTSEFSEIDDPYGFVRGLMRAAVPHVIASRWNVDSVVATDFMGEFYRNLLLGTEVAPAVRAAAEMVRQKRETSHPYYWATFTPFGLS